MARIDSVADDPALELRDFIENINAPLHWVGPDGTILWANRAELDLLGYSHEEYVGRHIAEFHAERGVIDDILARLSRNETLHGYPARLRHKDGSLRDVLINSSVLRREGEFIHTRCLTIDVTARRRIEEERQRVERRLATQYAVTRVLADAATLAEATPRILEAVGAAGAWSLAAIWTVDEAAGALRCVDLWRTSAPGLEEFEAATRAMTLPCGVGLPGRVWASGAPVWIQDTSTDGNFPRAPHARRAGLQGAFGFPIRTRGRVTGVLECFSHEARRPDPAVSELFTAIGAQIGEFAARRQAEEAMAESERRFRLLNRVGAAVTSTLDRQNVIQTVTDLATELTTAEFGAFFYNDVDEHSGDSYLLYALSGAPKDAFSSFPKPRATALFGPTFRGEGVIRLEDVTRDPRYGQNAPFHGMPAGHLPVRSYLAVPVQARAGEVLGALLFGHSAPGVFSAEHEQLVEGIAGWAGMALENARLYSDASRAIHARDEFISIASHELHNPINALQLQLVGLLRAAGRRGEGLPTEWVCERVGQAVDDVGRLVRLVHSLLDVSRINAGRLQLEVEDVDLAALLGSVVQRFESQVAPGQVTVRTGAPVVGHWDRLRLDQIVTNLLSNAVKYGGGKPILVALEADASTATLVVADEGIGIDLAAQAGLFERFQRGVSRREYGGFGLGLWITRKIVDAMGGTIEVESRPGEGATFRVRLPRQGVSMQP